MSLPALTNQIKQKKARSLRSRPLGAWVVAKSLYNAGAGAVVLVLV